MEKKDIRFEDMIARLCVNHYEERLPKRGKPQVNREWTILAGVVQAQRRPVSSVAKASQARSLGLKFDEKFEYEVVALGTGSKCLGLDKLSTNGDVIHDSHAEVIARRAFLRYLYDQLKKSILQEESIFINADARGEFQLKPHVTFHFFTSQTPCGDASIFPETTDDNHMQTSTDPVTVVDKVESFCQKDVSQVEPIDVGSTIESEKEIVVSVGSTLPVRISKGNQDKNIAEENLDINVRTDSCKRKREASPVCYEVQTKNAKLNLEDHAIDGSQDQKYKDHRTGAKCVPGNIQDPLNPSGYHTVGVLRLKPGRGNRSVSICCSDKIAKWNVLGCQGALLSHFLTEPIAFESIVIGKCSFSESATKRALLDRIHGVYSNLSYAVHHNISVFHSNVEFHHSKEYIKQHHIKSLGKIAPCGAAIIWSAVPNSPLDVSVKGVKQGVTSKDLKQCNARCDICKSKLFETFKEVVNLIPEDSLPCSLKNTELKTYWDYKQACGKYQESWRHLLQHFSTWIRTPVEYSQFS
ncbi:tRNA-specific adenosine deaminase 1-like [Anneissia japonica]|uniref:tRNA-specific adenosine deaminase 1-like n=1 Tax=Anneissia japonica TaxID=1529436 RepID=UPI00142597EF|nr:tRNA-specific adenosine deaminase 1-like [Anneissia japonica]